MCHYYTVHSTGMPSNAAMVPQLRLMTFLQQLITKYFKIWQWILFYVAKILEKLLFLNMQLTM